MWDSKLCGVEFCVQGFGFNVHGFELKSKGSI